MIPDEEIQRLRNEWLHVEQSLQKWTALSRQREELYDQEKALKDSLQANLIAMHQKQSYEPATAKQFKEIIDSQNKLLDQLKHKKSEIDHLLDVLEDNSPEKAGSLKSQLAEALIHRQPDQMEYYEKIKSAIIQNTVAKDELSHVVHVLDKLAELIEKTLNIRQSIKKRGILTYIFGSNPNVVITQHLQAAHLLTSTVLPIIKKNCLDHSLDDKVRENYTALISFLENFSLKCKERWGFKQIDIFFLPSWQNLKKHKEIFQNHLNKCLLDGQELNTKLNDWLRGQY